MGNSISRRQFLKSVGAGGLALPAAMPILASAASSKANDKINHVAFGGSGMSMHDIRQFAKHPRFRLHAVVDVDKNRAAKMMKKFPDAKFYWDWRQCLEKEAGNFETCNVSIPDHMHASVAMTALREGKHVYCQKPLCHNLHETRQLTEAAAKRDDLVTQMGIQIHSRPEYQVAKKIVQNGEIGKVHTVHLWSNKSNHWGRAEALAKEPAPVPKHLKWNYWLGVASPRRYVPKVYHPHNWRQWLDFGTGQLGDMGCHIFDPVYMGLALGAPSEVRSTGPEPEYGGWPMESCIHFQFPATDHTDPKGVELIWRDGGNLPPKDAQEDLGRYELPNQGSLWLGSKGTMVVPHVSSPRLFPQKQFRGNEYPSVDTKSHWRQFLDASHGKGETLAPFSYSGPLTEVVLGGTVALRFPKETLKWDAEQLRFSNHSAANEHLKREYRAGWEVEGLG